MTQSKANQLFMDIAYRFAQESHCLSYKVAAIAVKDQRIISTGINGSIAGSENCDEHFSKIYQSLLIGIRTREPSLEQWIKNQYRQEHHDFSLAYEIHAEQNMVATAAREGISLTGCNIYITAEPCDSCLKLLAAIRPQAIYFHELYDKTNNSGMYNTMRSLGCIIEQL